MYRLRGNSSCLTARWKQVQQCLSLLACCWVPRESRLSQQKFPGFSISSTGWQKDSQFKGCSMFPTESVCKIPRTRMESFTLHRTSQPFPHSHPVTNDSKKQAIGFENLGTHPASNEWTRRQNYVHESDLRNSFYLWLCIAAWSASVHAS